ncbi:hypothetical protein [Nitrosomonas communis]|uniref:hypothetical protein n=1 Tax=Nitrosomonas communis TaxID=44574 RepID=UPI0037095420
MNAGHTLEYPPSYSPDLNDIEPKWAQAKAIIKKEDCPIGLLFTSYARQIILFEIKYSSLRWPLPCTSDKNSCIK